MIINKRGSSLLELMFSVAIYAILSLFLLVIFRIGIKYWKDIENKTATERGLSVFSTDIASSVGNARQSDMAASFCQSTGDGWLLCSSAALNEKTLSVSSFSDRDFDFDSDAKSLSWNFKILYFSARHTKCPLCESLWSDGAEYCPHKVIVKRWFSIDDEELGMGMWDNHSSSYIDSAGKAIPLSATPVYAPMKYDRILAGNIIAFKPSVSGNIASYSVKACKNSVRIYYENSLVRDSIAVFCQKPVSDGTFEKQTEEEPMADNTVQISGSAAALN